MKKNKTKYFFLLCLSFLCFTSCSKEYNGKEFLKKATADPFDSGLTKLTMSFLRDLSKGKLSSEEVGSVFDSVTSIKLIHKIGITTEGGAGFISFKYFQDEANLDAQIIEHLTNNDLSLYNRYITCLNLKVYLNNKNTPISNTQKRITFSSGRISVYLDKKVKASEVYKVKICGDICVKDDKENKIVYSRKIDINAELKAEN